jgi:hypothetical protein
MVAEPAAPAALDTFLGRGEDLLKLAADLDGDQAALGEDLYALKAIVAARLVRLAALVTMRDNALAVGYLATVASALYDPRGGAADSGTLTGKMMDPDSGKAREVLLDAMGRAIDRHQSARRAKPHIGRNDPCLCGSGKKWKRCCGWAGGKGTEPDDHVPVQRMIDDRHLHGQDTGARTFRLTGYDDGYLIAEMDDTGETIRIPASPDLREAVRRGKYPGWTEGVADGQ